MVIAALSHRAWLFLALVCFLLPVSLANAALTASVDRTTISKNDIIQLTISSDQGQLQQTDFSELEQHFTIINQRSSNQISYINGNKHASYDRVFTLFPKSEGSLIIPAFKSRGESSQVINIKVAASSAANEQSQQQIFFNNTVNKQEVYVQEQLLYTLRLLHAVGLSEAQITPLEVENAVIEFVGDQKKYQTVIDGIRYAVVERQYAIFPEKSGELVLPEVVFTGRAISNYNSYNSRTNRDSVLGTNGYIRTKSDGFTINVLPKPSSYPSDETWLPTPALTISDSWSTGAPTLTVGESVTRTLTLSALNLDAAQLPDLSLPNVENLKMYPDQSRNENTATASGMVAQRIFSTAIVATRSGEIKIPESKITWWNTKSKQLEEAVIPARTITVKNAAYATNQPLVENYSTADTTSQEPAQQSSQKHDTNTVNNGVWPYLTLLFVLLWLTTIGLWWRSKRRTPEPPFESILGPKEQNTGAAYKTFKKACKHNNPTSARQSLLDWFRLKHDKTSSPQLMDISQHYQDDELARLIRTLEGCLYGNTADSWQGESLLNAITRLDKSQQAHSKNEKIGPLKPLYPF